VSIEVIERDCFVGCSCKQITQIRTTHRQNDPMQTKVLALDNQCYVTELATSRAR
jgi:hypothetical protein